MNLERIKGRCARRRRPVLHSQAVQAAALDSALDASEDDDTMPSSPLKRAHTFRLIGIALVWAALVCLLASYATAGAIFWALAMVAMNLECRSLRTAAGDYYTLNQHEDASMLTLNLDVGQTHTTTDGIRVVVLGIKDGRARIGISCEPAPKDKDEDQPRPTMANGENPRL